MIAPLTARQANLLWIASHNAGRDAQLRTAARALRDLRDGLTDSAALRDAARCLAALTPAEVVQAERELGEAA